MLEILSKPARKNGHPDPEFSGEGPPGISSEPGVLHLSALCTKSAV
jgi:hypothetical protein